MHTRHGTVGCLALDSAWHLAAGTSTGGMTAKRWGRVGDSPIIGAGTRGQDGVWAVSATGWESISCGRVSGMCDPGRPGDGEDLEGGMPPWNGSEWITTSKHQHYALSTDSSIRVLLTINAPMPYPGA